MRVSLAQDYKIAPELLFNIEDILNITVPPEPVTLTTLGDVVACIDGLIQAQSIADTPSKDAVSVPA